MESSRSPRRVMVLAWRLGTRCLPRHSSKYSRHDFTLPQLFACLALRQFYNLSYRRLAALLADCPDWWPDVELARAPDYRTVCDAFDTVTAAGPVAEMFDHLAACFAAEDLLGLDDKPLAVDSSCYESHHVSRHFERRRRDGRGEDALKTERSATVRGLPKLAVAVAAACHVVLAAWATTGAGADDPHWQPVLSDACRRAPVRLVVADAGYDSEAAHRYARDELGVAAVIPPDRGRPTDKPPPTPCRGQMRAAFDDGWVAGVYGQRWQVETVNSMMKRNYGSALRARTPERRERELMLKTIVHNVAL